MDAIRFISICLSASPTRVFALSLTPTSPAIGSIGMTPVEDRRNTAHSAEIGYWLGREYWGRGIMTTAVRAFIDHAFGGWESGTFKGAWKKRDVRLDLEFFALLREEWLEKKEKKKKKGSAQERSL